MSTLLDLLIKKGETPCKAFVSLLRENVKVKETFPAGGDGGSGRRPKPRQRTGRPQKPPLMPKPRSVPKREITLPLGFSTVTSALEDEGPLSVSDSYDPSRVERV